jgi:hypothetical protein
MMWNKNPLQQGDVCGDVSGRYCRRNRRLLCCDKIPPAASSGFGRGLGGYGGAK